MLRTLLSLLSANNRRTVIIHMLLTMLSTIIRAGTVVVLVPLLSALFSSTPTQAWDWVVLLVALTLIAWIIDWVIARLGFELGFGLLENGQHAVADQVARIRLTWFNSANTATARQAIASTGPELVGIMIYLVTPLLSAIALPIAIAVALLTINWILGLAALIGVPMLLGAYMAAGRFSRFADRAAMAANSGLTERIVEFARTQHALRAARRVTPERSQVGAALDKQHGALMRLVLMQVPGQLVFSVANQLALFLLAGTTVVLTVSGELSVPEAIALIVVIVRYLEPFSALAELSGGVETSVGTLRRIREVLDAPVDPVGEVDSAPGFKKIELDAVSFNYDSDSHAVIDELSLSFTAGSTTAIVGPSGSGKSTILALLAGLQHPTSGRVLIDGQDVAELSHSARIGLASMVFQEPYLFDGTILENIQAGYHSASAADIERAGRLAHVDCVARQLADGWDSRVGEAGTSLSGGERQRVSIARALLKPAPLLLVDEATSALDTENEAAIAAVLNNKDSGRTQIIVAHRLNTIRTADRVIFLEDGYIVEDGSVDELLGSGGRFAEFWRQQEAATSWQIVSGATT